MKTWKLSLSRIANYFAANKLVLILYLIGSVTCILSFVYFWGNYLTIKKTEAGDGYAYRTYTVSLPTPEIINSKVLERIQDKGNIQDIVLESQVPNTALSGKNRTETEETIPVQASFLNNSPIIARAGRAEFTAQELASGANVMVLPDGYTDLLRETQIDFLGERFTLAGVQEDQAVLLPYQTFLKQGFKTDRIIITLQHKLNRYDSSMFSDWLFQEFPGSKIGDPWLILNTRAQGQLPMELIILVITYILSLLSFIYILKYIQDENARENVIYNIVGASRHNVLKVMFLDSLLLSSISSTIAILLHVIFYRPLFQPLNTVSNLTYSPIDYFILFVMTVLLSVITIIPFLIRSLKYTLVSFYQKEQ